MATNKRGSHLQEQSHTKVIDGFDLRFVRKRQPCFFGEWKGTTPLLSSRVRSTVVCPSSGGLLGLLAA